MALRNRSHLPDDLFLALSAQGQRSANAIARPPAPPKPKALSKAQVDALLSMLARDPGAGDFSDLRSVERLAERGLAQHRGKGFSDRFAKYGLTDAGRALARALKDARTAQPTL